MTRVIPADKLSIFSSSFSGAEWVVVPVMQYIHTPPQINSVSFVVITDMTGDTFFIINIAHPDLEYASIPMASAISLIGSASKIYTINKKTFLHLLPLSGEKIVDLTLLASLRGLDTNEEITNRCYNQLVQTYDDVSVVPMAQLIDVYTSITKQAVLMAEFEYIENDEFIFYNNTAISALLSVERAGIAIDPVQCAFSPSLHTSPQYFQECFYPSYNLYTTTGRPSSGRGINFLALKKDGPERQAMVSHFNNGFLMEIDYSAYHLMLLINLLRIPIQYIYSSPYRYIAAIETGAQNPSETEINFAKQRVFAILYGTHTEARSDVLKQIIDFRQQLYSEYRHHTSPFMPIAHRKIGDNLPEHIVFNYVMQNIETKNSIVVMDLIQKYLATKQSKLIMYVYDSFLVDVCKDDDVTGLVNDLSNIISSNGTLPIKIKVGKSYARMKQLPAQEGYV